MALSPLCLLSSAQAKGAGQSVLPTLCEQHLSYLCRKHSIAASVPRESICRTFLIHLAAPVLLFRLSRRAAAVPREWDDERIGSVQERYVREKPDDEFKAPDD